MAGDERNRTQQGNNNAYCQDNPVSWLNWDPSPDADNLTAFVQALTKLRTSTPALRGARFPGPAGVSTPSEPTPNSGLQWFKPDGTAMTNPDWDRPESFSLTALVGDNLPNPSVLVLFNAFWEDMAFVLPSSPNGPWEIVLDTTTDTGMPASPGAGPAPATVTVRARSLVVATS